MGFKHSLSLCVCALQVRQVMSAQSCNVQSLWQWRSIWKLLVLCEAQRFHVMATIYSCSLPEALYVRTPLVLITRLEKPKTRRISCSHSTARAGIRKHTHVVGCERCDLLNTSDRVALAADVACESEPVITRTALLQWRIPRGWNKSSRLRLNFCCL